MPAGKRRQSNAMLYTLITFVALFVVATTAAVIYYVKAEELRTQATERQDELNKLVSQEELRNIGTIVGTRLPGQSGLGTVVDHLDQMVRLVKGAPVRVTSAEVKVAEARQAIQPLLEKARAYVTLPGPAPAATDPLKAAMEKLGDPAVKEALKKLDGLAQAGQTQEVGREAIKALGDLSEKLKQMQGNTQINAADAGKLADPNAAMAQIPLTTLIGDLLAKLDKVTQEKNTTDQQLNTLKGRFDDAIAVMEQTKKDLSDKVSACETQVGQIQADYGKLSSLVEQKSKEQLGTIQGDLEKARASAKQLNDSLLKTQAELNVSQGRLQGALTQVSETRPAPDKEAPAFKPDGSIVLVDDAAGVVHINLGSDDRVYQGLTFSVYDRTAGIPRDGKPKAQIEIFSIDRKVSTARVLSGDRKNPIATGDLIANLIWDPAKQNQFVVVGDFDVTGDGKPDYDGAARIEALIQKWGGVTAKEVSPQTDYVILGTEPKVPAEPTPAVQTADPTAREKYDAARRRSEQYNQIRQRAEALWVPIFNYDRFLNFTGYASQISKPGAL